MTQFGAVTQVKYFVNGQSVVRPTIKQQLALENYLKTNSVKGLGRFEERNDSLLGSKKIMELGNGAAESTEGPKRFLLTNSQYDLWSRSLPGANREPITHQNTVDRLIGSSKGALRVHLKPSGDSFILTKVKYNGPNQT